MVRRKITFVAVQLERRCMCKAIILQGFLAAAVISLGFQGNAALESSRVQNSLFSAM
jgi:hypothetical protein